LGIVGNKTNTVDIANMFKVDRATIYWTP